MFCYLVYRTNVREVHMKIVNPYKFISRLLILLLLVSAIYSYMPRQEALIELPEPMTTATVTVNAGDTLWTLAEKLTPAPSLQLGCGRREM